MVRVHTRTWTDFVIEDHRRGMENAFNSVQEGQLEI